MRIGVGLLVAAVLVGVLWLLRGRLGPWTITLVEWIRGAGAAGIIVYAVAYAGAALLLLPGSVLTLGAGFAYGPVWGTIIVSPVSVVASTLPFLLGRSVAREWVSRKVANHPRFAAVDQAVGVSGFKIVFLLRLSPIFPFNLLNYALGVTRVRLRDYVLASWLGMLPGTLLYVYVGSLVTSAGELLSGERPSAGASGRILYWGGLVATVIVTTLVTRIARKALNDALQTSGANPSNDQEKA